MDDAVKTATQFQSVDYRSPTQISETVSYECVDAGHIPCSSSVLLHQSRGSKPIRLLSSGDIGRPDLPIIRDPQLAREADYLIMENTYGGRIHKRGESVGDQLACVIRRTAAAGGRIIVPAFAVGRPQQLVLLLHELILEKRIPNLPVFVDSPLATNVTDVYRRHPECHDAETHKFMLDQREPFGFGRLRHTGNVEEFKTLNDIRQPFIVISFFHFGLTTVIIISV